MLNAGWLRSSFDKTVKRVRKTTFIITLSAMQFLPSFASRAEAIEPETANRFKGLAAEVMNLREEARVVNPNGTVSYKIPEATKRRLETEFKKIVKQLQKEVDEDLKQQNWAHAEKLIGLFYNFLKETGYEGSAKDLLELQKKIHGDFVSHIDLSRPGVYTISGSGRVYVITTGSFSRNIAMAEASASMSARTLLVSYLKAGNSRIQFFGVILATNVEQGSGGYRSNALVGFGKDGRIVLDDGTELTEKDIAQKLDRDRRFLPLK